MAKHLNFSAQITGKSVKIETLLHLVQFKDSGGYVIYAPELEVYGYGKTIKEAKDSFEICLVEFFEYTTAKGTLKKEMKRLGWEIRKRKDKVNYKLPVFTDLVENNKTLNNIFNEKDFKVFRQNVPMAIPV